jgi:hypothetical protein
MSVPRRTTTLSELTVDPPRRVTLTPAPMAAVSPDAERLCELLRQAQALATALSFQEKPTTTLLLVRATVYRAVYSHQEKLPDAVANLFYGSAAVLKEIALSSRRSAELPIAEPALATMGKIVQNHGQVPKERAFVVEPLSSASLAREHLGRYLAEIDVAPQDPNLRHFLALGALTELLVRTKLPPQTQQRLREIVTYAHREDRKTESIELMMTALQRIVAP